MALQLHAQKQVVFVVAPNNAVAIDAQHLLKNQRCRDSVQLTLALQDLRQKLYSKGYLAASFDSIAWMRDTAKVFVYVGNQSAQFFLRNIAVEGRFVDGLKLEAPKLYSIQSIADFKEKILINAENKGYPFATVFLDSLAYDAFTGFHQAVLCMHKNDAIIIDTIIIEGKARIRNKFLASYLKLRSGSFYNEKSITAIAKHIADLGFVEEEKVHKISFFNDKATINLFLKNRKTSKFDFLIGFLPNNASTGKLLVTGQARLNIVNPFGTGGEFLADWQKLQPKTQRLQLAINYPYFLNLPFGFDAKFDLYKRDTSNLDINYRIGLLYNFSGNNYLKGFFESRSTRLINADTALIKSSLQLPKILDTKISLYGLEYYFDNLNYKFNPSKGNFVRVLFGAGLKKIERNNLITRLTNPFTGESLKSLYDNIPARSVQLQVGIDYERYWPIKKRSTIKTSISAKAYISKNIFENEMFRLGGNRNLRGFDEESIFTPYYSIFTAEYRYLLSKNSYFYTFFDFGLVEDSRKRGKRIDTPFGFGAGVSLETKIGVFGISYALGKQLNNKIELRNSKIHFGYVAYF